MDTSIIVQQLGTYPQVKQLDSGKACIFEDPPTPRQPRRWVVQPHAHRVNSCKQPFAQACAVVRHKTKVNEANRDFSPTIHLENPSDAVV